jgi:pyruvate dehydrogenase E2 component (dihydrolipoamide acetyltransferase)
MITKVVLAKLSPTMEEGSIVRWNKNEGDAIKIGDVLAEIETDKANMEMEALSEGILRKVLVPAGTAAPVGSIIGVIAGADEDISEMLAAAEAEAQAAASPAKVEEKAPQTAPAPPPPPVAAPRPSVSVAAATPAKPSTHRTGSVKASPLARRMARERNITLSLVAGSGPGGRVIKRDIEGYTGGTTLGGTGRGYAFPEPAVPAGVQIPHTSMRKAIARRVTQSKFAAPHFYASIEIDMDQAVDLRKQLAAAEIKVSFNDLVIKGCSLALRAFPMVNATWTDDAIVTHANVDIGIAVALEDGLIIPVVRNADQKSMTAIASEVRELAGRARSKTLTPEEYDGATFAVSNLGMFGVTEFTAIINPPGSAILAVGAVRKTPIVDDHDNIRVGHRMTVTLSSDHRVIDGALAAQFLAELRKLIENPVLMLL